MNWLRTRLRQWLGITDPIDMVPFAQSLVDLEKHIQKIDRIVTPLADEFIDYRRRTDLNTTGVSALMAELSRTNGEIVNELEAFKKLPTLADVSRKQFEIDNAIQELKKVRDEINDPRRVPIRTRNGSQFRALMEQGE